MAEGLPKDTFIFEGVEASDPTFSVGEAAKVFFARSSHWLRLQENEGYLVLDGREVGTRRTEQGARYYTLPDIEEMAHALATKGRISGTQLANALKVAEDIAHVWELM